MALLLNSSMAKGHCRLFILAALLVPFLFLSENLNGQLVSGVKAEIMEQSWMPIAARR